MINKIHPDQALSVRSVQRVSPIWGAHPRRGTSLYFTYPSYQPWCMITPR